MANPDKLPLYLILFDQQKYFYLLVRNFPKEYKYTLGQAILDLGWKVLDAVIVANKVANQAKPPKILQISEYFDRLKNRLRMSYELKLISNARYAVIIEANEETGRMISGWLKWAHNAEALAERTEQSEKPKA